MTLLSLFLSLSRGAEEMAEPTKVALVWAPADGASLRYHVTTTLGLSPQQVGLRDTDHDGLVQLTAELHLACAPAADQEGLWCRVSAADVQPHAGSTKLLRVAYHASERLVGAELHVRMTADGRVAAVDVQTVELLHGPDGPLVRTVAERAVAGFDLSLPGQVAGPVSWTQGQSALVPSHAAVPVSRVHLVHRVGVAPLGLAVIETHGQTMWLQSRVFSEDRRVDGVIHARGLFDTERGVLASRHWTAQVGSLFAQTGQIELIEE